MHIASQYLANAPWIPSAVDLPRPSAKHFCTMNNSSAFAEHWFGGLSNAFASSDVGIPWLQISSLWSFLSSIWAARNAFPLRIYPRYPFSVFLTFVYSFTCAVRTFWRVGRLVASLMVFFFTEQCFSFPVWGLGDTRELDLGAIEQCVQERIKYIVCFPMTRPQADYVSASNCWRSPCDPVYILFWTGND